MIIDGKALSPDFFKVSLKFEMKDNNYPKTIEIKELSFSKSDNTSGLSDDEKKEIAVHFFLKLFYAKTFDSGLEGGDDEVEMDVEEYSYSRFLEHMYRMASQRCSIETFPELSKYGDVESIKGNIEQNDKRIQGQFLAFLWLSSIPTPCH